MSYKGGNSNHIYVFKATKKGKFKINFTTYKITVIVEWNNICNSHLSIIIVL